MYYYGARYLDPLFSRWVSTDPAFEKFLPVAPVDDEARQRNQQLPGMGGVLNQVNLAVYQYSANNPVKYVDPDGEVPSQYQIYQVQMEFISMIKGRMKQEYEYTISKLGQFGKDVTEAIDTGLVEFFELLGEGIKYESYREYCRDYRLQKLYEKIDSNTPPDVSMPSPYDELKTTFDVISIYIKKVYGEPITPEEFANEAGLWKNECKIQEKE